ncbi:MAG: type II toxin-antitoxin system RelE/ParE family toxin [Rhizobiales bacterium]|nr:type II toxin-antitoxin system RelE/ParE family toxin [Hyphomicrobiales bacterium]MBI3672761.1 type II toxin-antitoxin system RelE/ParE family toxin [Hyphomicrobiales bacterium]
MLEIRQTELFSAWLAKLRDQEAKAKIVSRIRRLALGNAGDVAPVGGGVSELRIHHGPGYRVYFMQRGTKLVILLCGGDRSSQSRDVGRAQTLAASWRN